MHIVVYCFVITNEQPIINKINKHTKRINHLLYFFDEVLNGPERGVEKDTDLMNDGVKWSDHPSPSIPLETALLDALNQAFALIKVLFIVELELNRIGNILSVFSLNNFVV